MELLVLSAADLHGLIGYAECADAMREALAARARGEVFQPLRSMHRPDGAAGFMVLMPAYQDGAAAGYGLKAICVTAANPAAGLDSHQGIVLLSSAATGEPLAVLNASAVTEIRTAAVSAVATALLARPGADTLAIIGTGVQARAHARAIAATRPLRQVRVAGRTPARAQSFAADLGGTVAGMAAPDGACGDAGVPVIPCASVQEAVAGAGIIVTATSSAVPVLRRPWLAPGAHVNAVGACVPAARELDTDTMAAAALFADSRESLLAEAGDFLIAAAEGAAVHDRVRAELGDLITGAAKGRAGDDELTVFESLGLATEDLAAAALACRLAAERRSGTQAPF